MTLKEEINALEELRFEIRKNTEISIKVRRNTETILITTLAIENAVLLFGNYEVKSIGVTMVCGYPSVEFVCIVPEYEPKQKEA